MYEIIMGMSVVVLRGNNLEIRLGLVFGLNLHSNHLQMRTRYPHSKEEHYTYSNQCTKLKVLIL